MLVNHWQIICGKIRQPEILKLPPNIFLDFFFFSNRFLFLVERQMLTVEWRQWLSILGATFYIWHYFLKDFNFRHVLP